VIALSGAAIARAGAAPSAATLLNTALRDATSRGSFHAAEARKLGKATSSTSEDLGANEGTQEISGSGGWRARVLVVGKTAYLSGNAAGLKTYFGFPAAVARKVGSRWVSVPSSNPGFAEASNDVTFASALAAITPSGHLTQTAATKIDGTPAIGIRGTGPALNSAGTATSLTLFISSTGKPLPLRATLDDGKGDTRTVTLSGWGEHVAVSAPHSAVPIISLAG
jgi:hypothetical protein